MKSTQKSVLAKRECVERHNGRHQRATLERTQWERNRRRVFVPGDAGALCGRPHGERAEDERAKLQLSRTESSRWPGWDLSALKVPGPVRGEQGAGRRVCPGVGHIFGGRAHRRSQVLPGRPISVCSLPLTGQCTHAGNDVIMNFIQIISKVKYIRYSLPVLQKIPKNLIPYYHY